MVVSPRDMLKYCADVRICVLNAPCGSELEELFSEVFCLVDLLSRRWVG